MRSGPDDDVPGYQVAGLLIDPAEVQAREAGFSSLDMRGRVLIQDDFGEGIGAWLPVADSGATAPYVLVSPSAADVGVYAFIAPNFVKADPGVTVDQISAMVRSLNLGQSNRIGIESAIFVKGVTPPKHTLEVKYNYNGTIYRAQLTFSPATNQWTIDTPSGVVVVSTITVLNSWAQVKVVADFSTGKYVRATIGENEIDISAHSMRVLTSVSQGTIFFTLLTQSRGAGTLPGYFGYALMTRDEP